MAFYCVLPGVFQESLFGKTYHIDSQWKVEDPSENMHCAFLGYPCVIINVQCAVSVLGP